MDVATSSKGQGAVIGGWICVALGAVLMWFSLFTLLLYAPLFLAGLVLAIVAIAQHRIGHGIPMLLLAAVIPLGVGPLLATYRTSAVLAEIDQRSKELQKPQASTAGAVSPGAASATTAAPLPVAEKEEVVYARDKIELYELSAKIYDTYSGKVPGVQFKLKNKGDRALSSVEVVVYFKDASGATIAEENYYPVNDSVMSEFRLLKPGYVWQQEAGKFYRAEQVPSEWKEGSVAATVASVEFQTEEK